MFNLEQAIAEWRRQMRAAGIKTPVPMEELEGHLREEIERQLQSGASQEKAFESAVVRIGKAEKLHKEFGKVEDVAGMRKRKLLLRWSTLGGIAFVYVTLGIAWYLGAHSGKLEISGWEIALAFGSMAPMLLLIRVGRSVAKALPVIHEGWVIGLQLTLMLFAAVLFRVFFPVISPTQMVHLQIVSLWMFSPTLGFATCFFEWFNRCKAVRQQSLEYV
jgi:hypothetical protein